MKSQLGSITVAVVMIGLAGCLPGAPEETGKNTPQGAAEQVDSKSYNALSPLQQYQVANKLTSALFKGVPASQFFAKETITANASTLRVSGDGSNYVDKVRNALSLPLSNRDAIVTEIEGDATATVPVAAKYSFDGTRRPLQYPLAYIYEMPLSEEFFARWMAYKLVNTIMFSPAEEIDSADEIDVQTLYENMVTALRANSPIRSIILAHEMSESNWRRFRSPEDNTREMIEIYLGLFDRDADVPKASRACKNWSLSDEDAGYKLVKDPSENTTPQQILGNFPGDGYWITSCQDFFEAVSNHPLVIPRVTTVLIDHMFGVEYDAAKRTALARDIAASNPTTFKEIFTAILFSKEFLLNMDRQKWFEESFFNVADRAYWRPYSGFFREINTNQTNTGINASLPQMYQPSFTLKLGRWPTVPGDVLAMSYQQNGLRSAVLIRSNAKLTTDPTFDPLASQSQGWGPELIDGTATLSTSDFIGYMFISVLGRMPTAAELSTLTQVIDTARTAATASTIDCVATTAGNGCLRYFNAGNVANRAMVVMDYLSRLPETFFFNAVN